MTDNFVCLCNVMWCDVLSPHEFLFNWNCIDDDFVVVVVDSFIDKCHTRVMCKCMNLFSFSFFFVSLLAWTTIFDRTNTHSTHLHRYTHTLFLTHSFLCSWNEHGLLHHRHGTCYYLGAVNTTSYQNSHNIIIVAFSMCFSVSFSCAFIECWIGMVFIAFYMRSHHFGWFSFQLAFVNETYLPHTHTLT